MGIQPTQVMIAPIPPTEDGRIIVARSVYPQRGYTAWVRVMAPDHHWQLWLLATRNFLRSSTRESVEVRYSEWDSPPAHEYRLMSPEEMAAFNERHPHGEQWPGEGQPR